MLKYIFALLCLPSLLFSAQLASFTKVKKHILQGKQVSVSINLEKYAPKILMHAYYTPRAIPVLDRRIAFSDKHLTLNNPNFKGKAVIEYVTCKLDKGANFYSL